MARRSAYPRRTLPRWRRPLGIAFAIGLLLAAAALLIYRDVQVRMRAITLPPPVQAAPDRIPALQAGGDIAWTLTLPHDHVAAAVDRVLPTRLVSSQDVQLLVPYWSLQPQEIQLTFDVIKVGGAQISVQGAVLALVQPLRLEVRAQAANVRETERREFLLTAEYTLALTPTWEIAVEATRPPRLLGLQAPLLFASVEPDLSTLRDRMQQVTAASLGADMQAALNAAVPLSSAAEALAKNLALSAPPPPWTQHRAEDEGARVRLAMADAALTATEVTPSAHLFDLVAGFTVAQGADPLPPLNTTKQTARALTVPLVLTAPYDQLQAALEQTLGTRPVAGGEVTVVAASVLGIADGAVLIDIEAQDLNPGGHWFLKRGRFHVLADVIFNPQEQDLRFGQARFADSQPGLSPLLRGQAWLRSPEMAEALLAGAGRLDQRAALSTWQNDLNQAFAQTLTVISNARTKARWAGNYIFRATRGEVGAPRYLADRVEIPIHIELDVTLTSTVEPNL